ncbi:hypothetical protein GY15_07095 [Delftia sp. 670]|nr:hypothetical protein GY15_07095 [Delftia sp. 670]
MACCRSSVGHSCWARSHSSRSFLATARSASKASTRVSTRRTLASRMGTRSEKQKDAMAPAVDRPMPGSVARSSALRGKAPPHSWTTAWAQRCRLRARL